MREGGEARARGVPVAAVEAVEEEREGEEDEEAEPDEDGGEDLDRGPSLRGWRRLRRRARWGLGRWRGGERSGVGGM